MTSPHDPDDPAAPLLSEAEERELTALLAAEGREPVATPPHVVARLDDVLAGLVADRAQPSDAGSPAGSPAGAPAGSPAGSAGASVVTLAGRTRARRWPQVLLAAAAVVVGGYTVGELAGNGVLEGGASDAGGAAGGGAGSAGEGQDESQADDRDGGLAGGEAMSVVPPVRADRLASDVRRVVRLFGERPVVMDDAQPSGAGSEGPGGAEGGGTVGEDRPCPVPRLTEGQRFYEVRFRGAPAGMVLGPPEGGSVDVTVYACDDGGVRLDRSVPAP